LLYKFTNKRQLHQKTEKYRIRPENTYNIDEKGFLIGIAGQAKRIFTTTGLKSGKIRGAGTDGSREWISIIACVSAIGDRLPPTLIYKGVSGDLQTAWIEDFDPLLQKANFVTSENGWTSHEIGFKWLSEIFEPQTRETCSKGLRKRLLIVDGHSSHVNRRFIDFCGDNDIILLVFPPHTTHRLQPLDVSVFAPRVARIPTPSTPISPVLQAFRGSQRGFSGAFSGLPGKQLLVWLISKAASKKQAFTPSIQLSYLRQSNGNPCNSQTIKLSLYHQSQPQIAKFESFPKKFCDPNQDSIPRFEPSQKWLKDYGFRVISSAIKSRT